MPRPPKGRLDDPFSSRKGPVAKGSSPDSIAPSDMFSFLSESLIRQSIEPNILAYKPHTKQAIFHESTCRSKLYIGGNRSGKTTGGVVEDLWWVTKRHPHRELPPGPIRGRVVGTDFESGVKQILIPVFKRWILPSDLINGSWEDSWSERAKVLTLANGSYLEFKSSDQEVVRHAGTSRHFIHFDEEPPKAIFDENLIRLIDTDGSFWITMTPTEGMTWVYWNLYEPHLKGELDRLEVIDVSMDENPYLTEEAKAQILSFMDEGDIETRRYGRFVPKGGLVFKHFVAGPPHVVKPFLPPIGWRIYVSIDHGVRNPTAILWHTVSPKGQVVTFHEHYVSDAIINDHADYIHKYNAANQINVTLYTGDPAMKQRNGVTGTSVIQEYGRNGIFLAVEGVPKDVGIGLDKMMRYLRSRKDNDNLPKWQITQDCINVIKEMSSYSWAVHSSPKMDDKSNPKQIPVKKNDHAIDSARYFFSLMPDITPESGEPVIDRIFEPGTYLGTLEDMTRLPSKEEGIYSPVKWTTVNSGISLNAHMEFAGLEGDE